MLSYVAQIALKSFINGGFDVDVERNTILNCIVPKLPIFAAVKTDSVKSYLTSEKELSLTGIDSLGVAAVNATSLILADEPPSRVL